MKSFGWHGNRVDGLREKGKGGGFERGQRRIFFFNIRVMEKDRSIRDVESR